MIIENIVVGPLEVNCFVLSCEKTGKAVVIDPGDDEDKIIDHVRKNNFQITDILLTHGHVDHIAAVPALKECFGAKIRLHRGDMFLIENAVLQAEMFGLRVPDIFHIDEFMNDADVIPVGDENLTVISTPGHSPGSVCFLAGKDLFAGDTLFFHSIGRTDLPGGSHQEIMKSIQNNLLVLDKDVKVYAGHGGPTTLEHEIRYNPFIAG